VNPSKDKKEQRGTIDEELLPYLNSVNEANSSEHLQRLLEKARPIVYRIARSMRVGVGHRHAATEFNAQDIFNDVCVRLLQSLRALRQNPRRHPVSNFAGLVATTTSTVFSDLLRGKDRHRRNLYEKIRSLIAGSPALETWKDNEGHLVCGYARWRTGSSSIVVKAGRPQLQLPFRSDDFAGEPKRNTAELVLLVLDNLGRPVKLAELVDLVNMAAEGVQVQTVSIDDTHYVQASPLATFQPDVIAGLDNQRLLNRLFAEIQNLRVEQRKSLLLNMSDSYGYGIEWFLFTHIATEEHLASLLEISIEQFRQLLNELPMSDAKIARELGVSQTKVMNIRRAVRERLERHRKAFFNESDSDSMRLK
jgi:RNA polymerase sigma factor (sigma-70 family)